MSIASEITRLQNAKSVLKTKLNAKNDAQHQIDDETIDEYGNFVDSIPTGSQVTKGLVFSDYDADGYPHDIKFVGSWTEIPAHYAHYIFASTSIGKYVKEVTIPNNVTTLGESAFNDCSGLQTVNFPASLTTIGGMAFRYCSSIKTVVLENNITFSGTQTFRFCSGLTSVTFGGNVSSITSTCFDSCSNVMLYDFSHCSSVPSLYNTGSLGHKSGCVIKIPSALSDTTLGTGNGWESGTNWSALANIVWEVV